MKKKEEKERVMKKITFVLFVLLLSFNVFAINYTVELVDSWGDGWNGGSLDVLVNGTVVLDDITLANGAGPESHTFAVAALDEITTSYTAGSYSTENEYQIKNEAGTVVAESGQGGVAPGNVSYTVPSADNPGVATDPNPADGAIDVAISGNLTWTWGANTDTYDLWFGEAGNMTEVVTGASATGTSGSYSYSGLSENTNYEWQLILHNSVRLTVEGPVWTFTTVLPNGMLQIGNGTATNKHLPIEPYYGYSYSQSIYLASDFGTIAADQRISKIYYNYHWTSNTDADANDWVIYMGTSNATNTDGGWFSIEGMTKVFDGSVGLDAVANGDGWLEIILSTPFNYNPSDGNLIIAVDENTPSYTSGSDEFYCSEDTRANVSRYYYNDSTNLDPADPSAQAGTASAFYPNARFQFEDIPAGPQFTISPESYDFGNVNLGESGTTSFTIINTGGGTLTITNGGISITGTNADQFALVAPTYPINLTSGQSLTINVNFSPTTEGVKNGNLTIVDNRNRMQHNVALTGTGHNPNITSLPYTQDFENAEAPALPLDWSKINDTGNSSSYVETYTSTYSAHGGSKCGKLYNYSATTGNLIMITPPYANTVDGTRVKFWAKSGSSDQNILVGTMSDRADASTFSLVQTIALTTTYTEYTVNFSGTDKYVAFKHALDGTYDSDYIDDVIWEEIPANPIFVISPESYDFGTINIGESETTSFTITNTGGGTLTIQDTDITFDGTNASDFTIESGTVFPINLTAGQTFSYNVIFTPSVNGDEVANMVIEDNIVSKVVHNIALTGTGFQLPAGQVQIGNGTATNEHLPIEPYYGYSYSQSIYLASDFGTIAADQRISKIYYNYHWTSNGNNGCNDWVIYMGTSNATNTDSGWFPINGMTKVFDGSVGLDAVANGDGWLEIALSTPFNYNPSDGNLIIAVDENTPSYTSGSDEFYCSEDTRANVSRYYYNDSTNLDPADPSAQAGTASAFYPNARFQFEDIPSGPQFAISPESYDFGTVNIGQSGTTSFTITNTGGGTFTINQGDITITGTNAQSFALATGISYPITIGSGATSQISVIFTPLTEGTLTAVLNIQDNLSSKVVNSIPLSGVGYVPPVGDTIENPFIVSFGNNLFTAIDSTNYMNDDYELPGFGTDNNDAVYKFTLNSDMIVDVSLLGSAFDTKLAIYGDSTNVNGWIPGPDNYLFYNDDYSGKSLSSVRQKENKKDRASQSAIYGMQLTAGSYFAIVDGYGSNNGVYNIEIDVRTNIQPPTLIAPADNATDLALSTYLDWEAPTTGATPDGYKVTINNVEVAANVTTTHYHPTNLAFGISYTWSVVSYVNSAKGLRTTIDSDPSPTWHFTTQTDPGNGSQGSQTGQGGNNGNNADPATVDIPPMADGNGGYVDPDVTVDPDDPQTITVNVTVNNENGAVPNPSGVGLSYDVNISGTVGSTVHITLSYEGMDPIPNEIIYFDGNTYQPVPNAVFGSTSVTFPWTISGSKGEDTFVVNNGQSSTLPVELSSFEATFTNENYVNLVWTTQSETDFMGFDVLRSTTENVSDAIKVNATLISGTNSSQENTYNFLDKEVELNQTYYYWLRILNNNGSSEFTNPRTVSTFGNNDTPDIPKITKLGNAYPNPFNPETHINFAISEDSHVNLSIYNVLGQKVKTFYNEEMAPGNYSITWKGLDSKNMKCSSGIYFYRLQTNNYKSIKKMLLLK